MQKPQRQQKALFCLSPPFGLQIRNRFFEMFQIALHRESHHGKLPLKFAHHRNGFFFDKNVGKFRFQIFQQNIGQYFFTLFFALGCIFFLHSLAYVFFELLQCLKFPQRHRKSIVECLCLFFLHHAKMHRKSCLLSREGLFMIRLGKRQNKLFVLVLFHALHLLFKSRNKDAGSQHQNMILRRPALDFFSVHLDRKINTNAISLFGGTRDCYQFRPSAGDFLKFFRDVFLLYRFGSFFLLRAVFLGNLFSPILFQSQCRHHRRNNRKLQRISFGKFRNIRLRMTDRFDFFPVHRIRPRLLNGTVGCLLQNGFPPYSLLHDISRGLARTKTFNLNRLCHRLNRGLHVLIPFLPCDGKLHFDFGLWQFLDFKHTKIKIMKNKEEKMEKRKSHRLSYPPSLPVYQSPCLSAYQPPCLSIY